MGHKKKLNLNEISSVGELNKNYKFWACDVWGVVHDGIEPNPIAVESLINYRKDGGIVILISNSPRSNYALIQQLKSIGVSDNAYDKVITSGQMSKLLLNKNSNKAIYHLGPARDNHIFKEAIIEPVKTLDEAEMILCTGLFDDDNEGPEDYEEMLSYAKSVNLPMICSNPDLEVMRGQKIVYCAGILAQSYNNMGGNVIYTGKPYKPIYHTLLDIANNISNEKLKFSDGLAIGDGIKTDIYGANNIGMDSLFIFSSLYYTMLQESKNKRDFDEQMNNKLTEIFLKLKHPPKAYQINLTW